MTLKMKAALALGATALLGLGACSINTAPPAAQPTPVVVQQPTVAPPPGTVVVMPKTGY